MIFIHVSAKSSISASFFLQIFEHTCSCYTPNFHCSTSCHCRHSNSFFRKDMSNFLTELTCIGNQFFQQFGCHFKTTKCQYRINIVVKIKFKLSLIFSSTCWSSHKHPERFITSFILPCQSTNLFLSDQGNQYHLLRRIWLHHKMSEHTQTPKFQSTLLLGIQSCIDAPHDDRLPCSSGIDYLFCWHCFYPNNQVFHGK